MEVISTMQTIITKVLPVTNTKPTRIKATSTSGLSVTVSRYSFDSMEDAHEAAVRALMGKLNWTGTMVGGNMKEGMVWVFARNAPTIRVY